MVNLPVDAIARDYRELRIFQHLHLSVTKEKEVQTQRTFTRSEGNFI